LLTSHTLEGNVETYTESDTGSMNLCENCRYYEPSASKVEGSCLRYPPHPKHGIPITRASSWCGEWAYVVRPQNPPATKIALSDIYITPICLQREAIGHHDVCPHCQEWSAQFKRGEPYSTEDIIVATEHYEKIMGGNDEDGMSEVS
jgi:hypothetical protein